MSTDKVYRITGKHLVSPLDDAPHTYHNYPEGTLVKIVKLNIDELDVGSLHEVKALEQKHLPHGLQTQVILENHLQEVQL